MVTDERLDLEFAYTSFSDACKSVYSIAQVCRRERGHSDEHACGYGEHRKRWTDGPLDGVPLVS